MATEMTFTARNYRGEADLQPMADIIAACEAQDKMDDDRDLNGLRRYITSPAFDALRDQQLWENATGKLVGLAAIWLAKGENVRDGFLYMRVLPEARDTGLEEQIVAWAEQRTQESAREDGLPATIYFDCRDYSTYYRTVGEHNGFRVSRYFYQMARPLSEPIPEPRFPEGIHLSHTNGVADAPKWVDMYNLSFIDHWGFHPAAVERHSYRLTQPDYRQERDLIGVADDGTFAGFCLCMIHPDDNARNNRNEGWIEVLGTRRGYRGIGLGKALLLAGLHLLKADGVETARLDVDAENPSGALGLYEATGFSKIATDMLYSKELGL